jgi:hypothetical protein
MVGVNELGTGLDAEGDLSAPRADAMPEALRRLKTLLDELAGCVDSPDHAEAATTLRNLTA